MFLCFIRIRRPPRSTRPATLFPDTSRFRAPRGRRDERQGVGKNGARRQGRPAVERGGARTGPDRARRQGRDRRGGDQAAPGAARGRGGAALGPRTIARARGGARKSVGWGKGLASRVILGVRRVLNKKKMYI